MTPKKIPSVEGYLCESDQCKGTEQIVTEHLTIKKLPSTLCIHIKRHELGGGGSTNKKKFQLVEFPLELNMLPYTSREQDGYWKNPKLCSKWMLSTASYYREKVIDATIKRSSSGSSGQSRGWYDLSSMIVHHGEMEGGHYVIFCKEDGRWLQFDDHAITRVSEDYVLDMNPYVLFYKQNDTSEEEDLEIESDPEIESNAEMESAAETESAAEMESAAKREVVARSEADAIRESNLFMEQFFDFDAAAETESDTEMESAPKMKSAPNMDPYFQRDSNDPDL